MPCKNPLIPLDNSKKHIEEKIAGIFKGFEMSVSENDWNKISEGLNSSESNNDFESLVKDGFAGFEIPLNKEEDLWNKIQSAINPAAPNTLEEKVAESFSGFNPRVTKGDWIAIKLGMWLGKFSRYLIPSVLIIGFLSLVVYKHNPPLKPELSYETKADPHVSRINKTAKDPIINQPEQKLPEPYINKPELESDNKNTYYKKDNSEAQNKDEQIVKNDLSTPSLPLKRSIISKKILAIEIHTESDTLKHEFIKSSNTNLLWVNPFNPSHIPAPEIYNKNYWVLDAPEIETLKQELIRPFNPPRSFSNYFVEAGLGYGNLHTNTKNENPSFRGMTLQTQKNTGQLKLNLAFGYRFLFGKTTLKIGVGADLTAASLNSNPYMKYQLIRVIDSFMHVTLQKDTYWFARKWDTLNIEIKNAPRTSWIEIPVQLQHTLFKSANTELYGGLGLYPGKLVSAGGYVGNPYASQPWTYWNYFYKNEPFNTSATALQAKQYLNNWRMGSGISLGLNQNLGYGGWIGVEAGFRKNGNIWRTNNVFLLRQQNNQYNIKFTMGLKF